MKVDADTIVGGIGTGMAIGFPLIDVLTHTLQFAGAVLGVILIFLSIRHKRMEIKKIKKELNGK